MKTFFLLMVLSFTLYSHAQVNAAADEDAQLLHHAQLGLTDVIIHDIFSPTGASRIYAYSNMAAYEVLVQNQPTYHSLHGQIKNFPKVPAPARRVNYPLSAIAAYYFTGKKLVYSDQMIEDSVKAVIRQFRNRKLPAAVIKASVEYGQLVADSILKWVSGDRYADTRKMRRYNLLKQEGAWAPTPPGYMAAVEPYWHIIRPLTLDSASQFRPLPVLAFSKDSSSSFYQEALEVYTTGKTISHVQHEIANFWDCNPYFLNVGGHLNFATKKISPGGHWMMITGIACRKDKADMMRSAAAYTLTAISIFDGFISCWEEKYRSNLIRPETYINAHIDENWRPLLQTPPFPEYPSGHSVVSTAAAQVLTHFFGNNFAFTDDSEVPFGLPVRHFSSFNQACEEAAISRLYGGIHYRAAIVNGQTQGKQVGEWVLSRVKLKKV
jgi:hypothetical protein